MKTGRRLFFRRLFVVVAVASLLIGAYSYNRGLRYPPLQFDPAALPTSVELERATVTAEGAYLVKNEYPPRFRAFAPSPTIRVEWRQPGGGEVRQVG